MAELTGPVGFASSITGSTVSRRRILRIELIATAALAASLIIAVTAVSIGMAHAQTQGAVLTRALHR